MDKIKRKLALAAIVFGVPAATYMAGSYFTRASAYETGFKAGTKQAQTDVLRTVQETMYIQVGDFDGNGESDVYVFGIGKQPVAKFFGTVGPKGTTYERKSPVQTQREQERDAANSRLEDAVKRFSQPGPLKP